MGCWSETCFLTNLPILAGEEIVVLPIIQNLTTTPETELSMSYSFERWKPFSFPLRATYDDYGTPENIVEGFEHDIFNFMIEEYLSNKDEIEIRPEHDNKRDVALWRHISKGEAFHKTKNIFNAGKQELFYISSVMIKASVFDELVREAPERDFRPVTRDELEGGDFIKFIDLIKSENSGMSSFIKQSDSSRTYRTLFEDYERGFNYVKPDILHFLKQYVDTYDRDKIKKAMVDFVIFTGYVESLRLVLAPTTGKGSQSIEEEIHLKLNVIRTMEIKKIMEYWD